MTDGRDKRGSPLPPSLFIVRLWKLVLKLMGYRYLFYPRSWLGDDDRRATPSEEAQLEALLSTVGEYDPQRKLNWNETRRQISRRDDGSNTSEASV